MERFGPVQVKPYIAKGGRRQFKRHVAAVEGAEMLPALWKTKFGVKFAGWAFTRHASPEGFPSDTLCVKCFGPKGASSSSHVPQVPTSSSSASSSSGSE